MYKFCIKTGVLYPKIHIWSGKNKTIVLFTLKIKFLPKNLTKMFKFGINTGVLYPKLYIWSQKTKNCTFYTKNEVFAKQFHQNVHLVLKNGKICTFYTNNENFAKKFHQNVQILDKNCSFIPQNIHLVSKKQ